MKTVPSELMAMLESVLPSYISACPTLDEATTQTNVRRVILYTEHFFLYTECFFIFASRFSLPQRRAAAPAAFGSAGDHVPARVSIEPIEPPFSRSRADWCALERA